MITSTIGCATIRFRYESLCLYRNGLSNNNISLLIREIHHSQSKRKERSQSSKQWLDRQQKDPYVQKALELGLPSRAYFKLQEINEVIFPNLILKNKKKKRGSRVSNYSRRKRLIEPYMSVLDLGAAPGGWSLYASEQLNSSLGGTVVAVDLLSLDETLQSTHSDILSRIEANLQSNFHYVQGDFTNNDVRVKIMEIFSTSKSNNATNRTTDGEEESGSPHAGIDLIISDMAANFLGDQQTDALRTLDLCEQALAFACYSACDDKGSLRDGGSFLCKFFSAGKEQRKIYS